MLEFIRESFSAIRVLTSVASIIAIFLNCFYLYYLFKGKKDGKTLTQYVGKFFSKKSGIILCEIVMVCGILLSPPIYSNFENTTIAFVGDGSKIYKDKIQDYFSNARFVDDGMNDLNSYSLGLAGLVHYNENIDIGDVLPLYLKKPQAQRLLEEREKNK